MIYELLEPGRDNTKTGSELARLLKCDIRDITEQVERERREGQPICAATGSNPGYYLAEDAEELEGYCRQLHKRAGEIYKTRGALLKTAQQMRGGGANGENDR